MPKDSFSLMIHGGAGALNNVKDDKTAVRISQLDQARLKHRIMLDHDETDEDTEEQKYGTIGAVAWDGWATPRSSVPAYTPITKPAQSPPQVLAKTSS